MSAAFRLNVAGRPDGSSELRAPGAHGPLHRFETALVAVTALHLCFLPWALGDMHPWSQFASAACAVAGLALVALPRRRDPGAASPGTGWFVPAAALRGFLPFWAGLALLVYVAAQACNPAWRYQADAHSWWLVPIAHVAWLPAGVAGPFERSNPWRALTIFGTCWGLVCSVWAGFERRQSYLLLLDLLVGNGVILAAVGLLERGTDTARIFWFYLPSNAQFAASFIYRNHAGAYFNLLVGLAFGLTWWHAQRAHHGRESPLLAVAFGFAAALLGAMVVFTFSRMAIVLLIGFTALIAFALGVRLRQRRQTASRQPESLLLALALTCLLGVALLCIRSDDLEARFSAISSSDPAASGHDRATVRAAAEDMLRDRWLWGWGAGCFRYGFPLYAQHYPAIYFSPTNEKRYWEHAHDDLLEFPVELGALGSAPLLLMGVFGAVQLVRRRVWRHPGALSLVLACSLLLVHAGVDFVFQNPAVLLTWCVLLVAAGRWAELDPAPVRRRLPLTRQTAYIQGPSASSLA